MNTVSFTKVKLPFGWMGNMSPYPITYKNKVWPTAEALFQALRYNDKEVQEAIMAERSPMSAKMVSKRYASQRTVEAMSPKDVENMEMVLRLKLSQHPELKNELKSTGKKVIVEDCSNRPGGSGMFWGACFKSGQWVGENTLGKLWMKLRDEL